MGASGHADDPHHPQQRDHQEPENFPIQTFQQSMVSPHPTCAAVRPWMVHVPDQHRSDGAEVRISGSDRYETM